MSLIYLFLFASVSLASAGKHVRVCYYTNWSQYRLAPMQYVPENIDPSLCTHIIYAFTTINGDHTFGVSEDKMLKRLEKVKQNNPRLKTLLAVGGWGYSNLFSQMVATARTRQIFIDSAIAFLRKNGFDGLDLDWEFPSNQEKQLFSKLCEELSVAFENEALGPGKERMLLTAAVSAGYGTIDRAYDIPELAKSLDFINLMTYDLHGKWEAKTGHHTAMVGADKLTVPYAVEYWMKGGMPANKITLGMATYGRAFKLTSANEDGLNSPASGNPPQGKYTMEAGILSYYEICTMGLRIVEDNTAGAPYGYSGDTWVGFDTPGSLVNDKVALIKEKGLLGAMFWTLDMDDFRGSECGEGPYPLLTAVTRALEGDSQPTTKPEPSTMKPVLPENFLTKIK